MPAQPKEAAEFETTVPVPQTPPALSVNTDPEYEAAFWEMVRQRETAGDPEDFSTITSTSTEPPATAMETTTEAPAPTTTPDEPEVASTEAEATTTTTSTEEVTPTTTTTTTTTASTTTTSEPLLEAGVANVAALRGIDTLLETGDSKREYFHLISFNDC